MGLDEQFQKAKEVVGGLLSAYDLSGDKVFLEKARDIADRLLPAWDTPSGIPYNMINLAAGNPHNPSWTGFYLKTTSLNLKPVLSIVSRDRSISLSSDSLSNQRFTLQVEKVITELLKNFPADGLLPIFLNPHSGSSSYSTITFGTNCVHLSSPKELLEGLQAIEQIIGEIIRKLQATIPSLSMINENIHHGKMFEHEAYVSFQHLKSVMNAKTIREQRSATREQRSATKEWRSERTTREQRREGEEHDDAEARGRPGSRGARVRNTTTQRRLDDREQRREGQSTYRGLCFGDEPEEEYSDEEKLIYEKEEDEVLFLYGDGEVDLIFFEEDSDNFDEEPKFNGVGCEFVEDKLVFGDDNIVIEVISHSKSPGILEKVVGDAIVEKCEDNYPVEGVMETKLKFAMVKHFCSLTNITKGKLVEEVLQNP
ncbi:hypothetical protein Scep_028109 [Stephania cephalantha]|uniref:alpha-1,2-Mannosidase n=1 Tax=Stephania cephalantha TaxID=152367 RepID=A0AAP0EDX4_9MAGN